MLTLIVQFGQPFQVDGLELVDQIAALGVAESIPEGQDVFLSVALQLLSQLIRYCYLGRCHEHLMRES
jgi:hypothetical protein